MFIGTLAGILCAVSFFPQVIKIYKSKNTRDLALSTFIMFSAGVFLWFLYGLMIKDLPVIITNLFIFILSVFILFMKIRYRGGTDDK